jgi:hypothetical protein
MKVLIDECSPRALKRHLADHGHECVTVQEAGWAGKKNGELLDLADHSIYSWRRAFRGSIFTELRAGR